MTKPSDRMIAKILQVFALRRSVVSSSPMPLSSLAWDVSEEGARWLVALAASDPGEGRDLKGCCVTFAGREDLCGSAAGESLRSMGSSPWALSTVVCMGRPIVIHSR